MANFADGGKTIIVSAAPPPPPPPAASRSWRFATAAAETAQPKPPATPRFLVIIDPAHGGNDTGAAITAVARGEGRRARRWHGGCSANWGIAELPPPCCATADVAMSLDQRAAATNAVAPGALHRACMQPTPAEAYTCSPRCCRRRICRVTAFLPWDTAQAAFLDLSGSVAGSIAVGVGNSQAAQRHAGCAAAADEQYRRTRGRYRDCAA